MYKSDSLTRRLSGGTHPRAVSLAVFLGLLAGFAQGWNLSLAALLVLIVLFDVRSRVALICWGIGVGLSWALAPATFLLGRVVLDLTPLGTWLGDCEGVAALLGWDRYTLVGGLLIGLALAWPASSLLTRGVRRTRRMLRSARELRSRLNTAAAPAVIAFPRERISWRARLADWLRSPRGEAAAGTDSGPLFRPGGIPAAAALALLAFGTLFWHVPRMINGRMYLAFQEANQARLEAAEFRLALWNGLLHINDLRLADPNCLTHDRVRIEQLRAELDPEALLRGRLAVRRLDVSGVRTHVPRAEPAAPIPEANRWPAPAVTTTDSQPPGDGPGESTKLEAHLAHWPEIERAIVRFGSLLEQLQGLHHFEEPRVAPLSLTAIARTDLVTLRRMRSPLGQREPRIALATLRAESLDPVWGLGPQATLQVTRLASRAISAATSPRLEIVAPEHGTRVTGEYAPHQGRPRWRVSLEAREIPAANLLAPASTDLPIRFEGGRVRLVGTGWADATGFELPLVIQADSIACRAVHPSNIAEIDAEHWATGLERLQRFALEARCRGTWHEPGLRLDAEKIATRFRQDLLAANQHDLLAAMGGQVPPTSAVPDTSSTIARSDTNQPQLDGGSEQGIASAALPQAGSPATPPATPPTGGAVASPGQKTVYPILAAAADHQARRALAAAQSTAGEPPVSAGETDSPAEPATTPSPASTGHSTTDAQLTEVSAEPLQGPGPLNLTLGHDMTANLWQPSRQPHNTDVAQTVATSAVGGSEIDSHNQSDRAGAAELGQWVRQQEQIEARRQDEFATQPSRAPAAPEQAGTQSNHDESTRVAPERPGMLARIRSLWPFGKRGGDASAVEDLSPVESKVESARTARGKFPSTSAGGTSWQ